MKLKTIVIDDEQAFIRNLKSILLAKVNDIEVVASARGVNEGLAKINEFEPDLVFLDIQMGDGTGFDLLRKLERVDFKVIFVTAYDQYAIEAFQFSAVDYLLKPVVSTDLWRALEKAQKEIELSKNSIELAILMENINSLSYGKRSLYCAKVICCM